MRLTRRTPRAPALKRLTPRAIKLSPPKRKGQVRLGDPARPARAQVSPPYPGAKRSDPATSARTLANQSSNLSKGAPTY